MNTTIPEENKRVAQKYASKRERVACKPFSKYSFPTYVGKHCRCISRQDKPEYTCYFCQFACCDEAIEVSCVCLFSYKCNKHGSECVGSHS